MNSSLLAIEKSLVNEFNRIDDICLINSKKVLDAFHAAGVCDIVHVGLVLSILNVQVVFVVIFLFHA